jgi:hypothetical protein
LVGATLSEYPPMRSLEKKNRILALALTTIPKIIYVG